MILINPKTKYLFLVLLLVSFLTTILIYVPKLNYNTSTPTLISNEFNGNLVEIRDNSVILEGSFLVNDDSIPTSIPEDVTRAEIFLTPSTKITKVLIYIPNTRNMFKVADLPKEESVATLKILKEDSLGKTIGVQVIAGDNIFGKSKFEANELIYRIPVFPMFNGNNPNP